MREIVIQQPNLKIPPLTIHVLDEQANGHRNRYEVTGFPDDPLILQFQTGDPAERVNGITDDALITVLIDRQFGLQQSPDDPEAVEIREYLQAALDLSRQREARLAQEAQPRS